MFQAPSKVARLAAATAALLGAGGGAFALAPAASADTSTLITITSMSTQKGSTAGGTYVVITGSGFNSVADTDLDGFADLSAVYFGTTGAGNSATTNNATVVTVVDDTLLLAKAPAVAAGKVDVTIKDSAGNTTANTAKDDFTFIDPVSVTSITSASGVVGDSTANTPVFALFNPLGGSTVTLGFSTPALTQPAATKLTVTFAGANGAVLTTTGSYTWTAGTAASGNNAATPSTGTLKVTAPAGTPGANAVKVVIYNDGVAGTGNSLDSKYAAVISSLSRTTAPLSGVSGSLSTTPPTPALTVYGKGLQGVTQLTVSGASNASLTCAGVTGKLDTQLNCASIPAVTTAGAYSLTFTPTTSTIPVAVVGPSGSGTTATTGNTLTYVTA
ncbi:IPT/TIG domain-containing protein [Cryptosporangium phraense]|uniref:IPT/TIG domain-containing protein n=1 Tax=Cryptosporangium phraense TaxID=2593070 RepID=A0A545AZL4_9ACTN|nr:IPT/TIG domain-containing protein [Cryptosporangium phraense]TQS46744.1 hypothetical protein FL583_00235 [Cryptosporangium phraense]